MGLATRIGRPADNAVLLPGVALWEDGMRTGEPSSTRKEVNDIRELRWSALVVLLACSGCAGAFNDTSASSCVGPYMTNVATGPRDSATAVSVNAGDTITIYGHWYTTTCNDTGGNEPLKPLPVHLTLTFPDGTSQALGQVNPSGPQMGFSITVRIPAGTHSGTASVSDDRDYPATYRFHIAS